MKSLLANGLIPPVGRVRIGILVIAFFMTSLCLFRSGLFLGRRLSLWLRLGSLLSPFWLRAALWLHFPLWLRLGSLLSPFWLRAALWLHFPLWFGLDFRLMPWCLRNRLASYFLLGLDVALRFELCFRLVPLCRCFLLGLDRRLTLRPMLQFFWSWLSLRLDRVIGF